MKSLRALIVPLVLTAGVSASILASSSPASAATPNCTRQEYWASDNSGVGFVWAPVNSSGSTVRCTMRRGAEHSGVKALQSALRYCYNQDITIDGDFGSGTESALKRVQTRIGVSSDGIYGPTTATHISMRAVTDDGCGRIS